jgi:hypothetical protein
MIFIQSKPFLMIFIQSKSYSPKRLYLILFQSISFLQKGFTCFYPIKKHFQKSFAQTKNHLPTSFGGETHDLLFLA